MLHHIEMTIKDAGAVPGDGRFTDYLGSSISVSLLALKGCNQKRHKAMINEAKEVKDVAIKDMDDSSQEILTKAFKDLKNGEINETEYFEYLNELRKLQNDRNSDEEVSENFIKYVMDNIDGVSNDFENNSIAAFINQEIKNSGSHKLNRAEIVKAMNVNNPSPTSNYLKESGMRNLNVGRALSGSLIALTIGYGIYIDYSHNDKTVGEAFSKNATGGGIGLGAGAVGYISVHAGAVILGASNPVGWAIGGSIVLATGLTAGFNWAYDNNFGGMQDSLDWAGQQIDKGLDWADEQLNMVGEALSSGLDFINPFS
ncbi:hypothetical protein [Pseudogracilibacillus auburnensis]|uniref:hypothetical protein n=1 Tax=Pseudogracilibacillus auburnensis TaxID=1494959 RepID=UPI001A96B70E|nr:hypothetical protein [Pseudogracilibacillus auburnensis]MBO1003921.1 hypothetical protein [Pseudogracilibacillus auburnensis]